MDREEKLSKDGLRRETEQRWIEQGETILQLQEKLRKLMEIERRYVARI